MFQSNHTFVLMLIGSVAMSATADRTQAASCEAHFEIRYGSFKPDVPNNHFEAHQARAKGKTDNEARRRAREKAQACMSALWRDRWALQNGDSTAAPECRISLGDSTVIRPVTVSGMDIKRNLERAACLHEDSNMKTMRNATAKIYKRTHGAAGCGPNLKTVESRFLSDYTFDCQAIRAREGASVKRTKVTEDEGWDRPGMDYRSFTSPSPQSCFEACNDDSKCRSWSWVKRGVQGPGAKCWLKEGVPWARKSSCCFSGVTR